MSARRPPEFVIAASTPGYLARIASATMLPIADSLQAGRVAQDVGRLRPDHLVAQDRPSRRSPASTIAWTSARGATPMFLATRVDAARPLDVAVPDHHLDHRVAAAGVDALDDGDLADDSVGDAMGVAGDDEVDRRVLQLLRDVDDRARPTAPAGCRRPRWRRVGALVDHDDLDLRRPGARSRSDSMLDPLGLVEERQPCGRAGATSSGVFSSVGADHADLDRR